jgi:predicted nucleic acid-binding protein
MGSNVVPAAEAWKLYESLFQDSRVRFAPEPPSLEEAWRTHTRAHHQGHNFWTDAYLAAFATAADLTLLTFDSAFARRKGLHVRVLA